MRRTLFEWIEMDCNDIPGKLEWSIHPLSGTDSAQWDWGIMLYLMFCPMLIVL